MVDGKSPQRSKPAEGRRDGANLREGLTATVTCANVPSMNNIDPDILALAKGDYGDNCELVRRTEWSYSFKCGPKSYCSISRFMAESGFEVNATEIRTRWPSMDERERMDFAANFQKKTWTDNETEILEIMMTDGSDRIWS